MPIYEYEAVSPEASCDRCRHGFETVQSLREKPLECCPDCGAGVKRVLSRCRALVVEHSEVQTHVEQRLTSYEKEGKWSHAAELADKHSEKTQDRQMKTRALENYRKAGYDVDSMTKSS
ncbi:MAG: zinc ribbon domain-containing protein [Deltaproteobacteria bacterium]|nr:zinc ribbon domain-containing protein [Deltaproteobacteria bacterium]